MWAVFDDSNNMVTRSDDLYEAEILAESIHGRIELQEV